MTETINREQLGCISRRGFLGLAAGGAALALTGCNNSNIEGIRKEKLRITLEQFGDVLKVHSYNNSVIFISINTSDLSNNDKINRVRQVIDHITKYARELGYTYQIDTQKADEKTVATLLRPYYIRKMQTRSTNAMVEAVMKATGSALVAFLSYLVAEDMIGVNDYKEQFKRVEQEIRDSDKTVGDSKYLELNRLRREILMGRIGAATIAAIPTTLTYLGIKSLLHYISMPNIVIKIN